MEGVTSCALIDLAQSDTSPSAILIVEDEVMIRFAVSDYLRECGFQVVEAASADEAIEILLDRSVEVDLIFSDIQMPGTHDGLGLAQWARRHRPELPVILTSGNVRTADLAEELCALGPIETKPYDMALLTQRMWACLESRASKAVMSGQ